jgi:hypothetical protein
MAQVAETGLSLTPSLLAASFLRIRKRTIPHLRRSQICPAGAVEEEVVVEVVTNRNGV